MGRREGGRDASGPRAFDVTSGKLARAVRHLDPRAVEVADVVELAGEASEPLGSIDEAQIAELFRPALVPGSCARDRFWTVGRVPRPRHDPSVKVGQGSGPRGHRWQRDGKVSTAPELGSEDSGTTPAQSLRP